MTIAKNIEAILAKSSWIRKMFEEGARLKARHGADRVFDFSLGNPNLEAETTVSYQAGIKHQFTDFIAGQFSLYSKDIYDLIAATQVTDEQTGQTLDRYINQAYASARGIEVTLEKRYSDNYQFNFSYTYSFADGVENGQPLAELAAPGACRHHLLRLEPQPLAPAPAEAPGLDGHDARLAGLHHPLHRGRNHRFRCGRYFHGRLGGRPQLSLPQYGN